MKKISIILISLLALLTGQANAADVKRAEFAGTWYPGNKLALEAMIDNFIARAQVDETKSEIFGIISPHAGYQYSGPVAAYGFKALKGKRFDAVILLGPTHRYAFRGVSIYAEGAMATPLGKLTIDKDLAQKFSPLRFVQFEPKYFKGEHCLEVELPFIRRVLGRVNIVPVLFGQVTRQMLEEFAKRLFELSKYKKILVVVSTDLSHYLPYDEAMRKDLRTLRLIRNKDTPELWRSKQENKGLACGISGMIAFLHYVRLKQGRVKVLKYANSGDTAGDKSKVVGYVSAIAYGHLEPLREQEIKTGADMDDYVLNDKEKKTLLNIARQTLEAHLKGKKAPDFTIESENLKQQRGAFVTLKKKGQLRGCIGRIIADVSLDKVISSVVISSATGDPRFPKVTYKELDDIEIEISVLTPFVRVKDLEEIKVGTHGLMIRKGFFSGILLPQVPLEWGWDRETFLRQVCRKAGLSPDAYKDKHAILERFSAIVFNESEFAGD